MPSVAGLPHRAPFGLVPILTDARNASTSPTCTVGAENALHGTATSAGAWPGTGKLVTQRVSPLATVVPFCRSSTWTSNTSLPPPESATPSLTCAVPSDVSCTRPARARPVR